MWIIRKHYVFIQVVFIELIHFKLDIVSCNKSSYLINTHDSIYILLSSHGLNAGDSEGDVWSLNSSLTGSTWSHDHTVLPGATSHELRPMLTKSIRTETFLIFERVVDIHFLPTMHCTKDMEEPGRNSIWMWTVMKRLREHLDNKLYNFLLVLKSNSDVCWFLVY